MDLHNELEDDLNMCFFSYKSLLRAHKINCLKIVTKDHIMSRCSNRVKATALNIKLPYDYRCKRKLWFSNLLLYLDKKPLHFTCNLREACGACCH